MITKPSHRRTPKQITDWDDAQWQKFALEQFFRDDDDVKYTLEDVRHAALMQLARKNKDKLEFVRIEELNELSREKLGETLPSITTQK